MVTTDWNQIFSSNEDIIYTLFALMGMFLVFILAISLIFLVLKVVGRWKMFEKANEAGWKALIPIYNTYTQCKITGISAYWIFIIFIGYLLSSFCSPFRIITDIVNVYFLVILSMSTARSFGKSDGIGIGLFLLAPVFNMIVGCDSSKYEGKKPFGDIILPMDSSNVSSVNSVNKTTSKVSPEKKATTQKKAAVKKTPAKKTTTTKKTTTKKAPVKKTSATKKTTTKKSTKK